MYCLGITIGLTKIKKNNMILTLESRGGELSSSVLYSRLRGCGFKPHWCHCLVYLSKVSKGAKIRSRYNQVPHPIQDTKGKVTNSQLDTTNESQEVSPFPAGDHKAHINRRTQRHSKHKTEQKHNRSAKEVPPWNGQ